MLAGEPVGGKIERLHHEGGEGDIGRGGAQLRGGELAPGITRVAQLQGLPGALQVKGAVLVGPHLLIAQGDQGAGNGRLGLGVNDLAVIAFGRGGRRLWSGLQPPGPLWLGLGWLGVPWSGRGRPLGGLGRGCAGNGFLGLAGRGLGVISYRRAGQDQGHHQNEPAQREFLLHIDLFKPAALPARPEYF